jgi:RNA polymerase sporulation-specific sigma factor
MHQYIGPALRRSNRLFTSNSVEVVYRKRPHTPLPRNLKWLDRNGDPGSINFLSPPAHEGGHGRPIFDRANSQWLSATFSDANVGNVSAKVTAKVGATKNHHQLLAAAESARTLNAAKKTWADIRSAGKVRCGSDATRVYAAKERAELTVYRKQRKRRWPPSPIHIEERALARRYGIAPRLFGEWRSQRGFPPPISDFGVYDKPRENWWHISAIAAWDIRQPHRQWSGEYASDKRSQLQIKNLPYTPQTTSRQIYFRGPIDLVSDAAMERSKKNDARLPQTRTKTVLLTPEEERELVTLAKGGDLAARNKIILAHLPLLRKVAQRYQGPDFEIEELIQVGIGHGGDGDKPANGLIYALEHIDPAGVARLRTFAQEPIRWAIVAHVRKGRKEILLSAFDSCDDEGVITNPLSDRPIEENEYGDESEYDREFFEIASSELNKKLSALNQRERYIFETHHGLNGKNNKTLQELGTELGITRERARQIEAKALQKISGRGP